MSGNGLALLSSGLAWHHTQRNGQGLDHSIVSKENWGLLGDHVDAGLLGSDMDLIVDTTAAARLLETGTKDPGGYQDSC